MDSFNSFLDSLGGAFKNVYGSLNPPKTAAPSPVANNSSANGTATAKAWLPWAIAGGVLLFVVILIPALRK